MFEPCSHTRLIFLVHVSVSNSRNFDHSIMSAKNRLFIAQKLHGKQLENEQN